MQLDLMPLSNENLLPHQGTMHYFDAFFKKAVADQYFKLLKNEVPWKQEPIKLFGKSIMQPRLTALFGDPDKPYGYSGIKMIPLDWTDFLAEIKERIEYQAKVNFTHVLLNYYRNGTDSMGWHRDNEPVLGKNPTIASVTFGAVREFQVRDYEKKKTKLKVPLGHGSLLLMGGSSQHHWEHQIPKITKPVGTRINLTFRKIL